MPSGSQFEVYGNPGRLDGLADTQFTYQARFDAILDQLSTVAATTRGDWSGAGRDQYGASHIAQTAEYQEVQAQFRKLAELTTEAARRWQQVCTFANSKFEL